MFRSQDPLGLNPNDAFNFLDDQVYLMSKGAPTSLPAGKVAVEVRTQLVQLDPLPAKITINEAKMDKNDTESTQKSTYSNLS